MPYRVMHSHGPSFKEYGICNGSKGRLKAWELSDKDQAMLQKNNDNIVILTDLPKTLFLEMDTPMKKPYPGIPDRWFPMRPTAVTWSLDAEENITIDRK
eukprot:12429459-Karenia_brevis.AAC.1